MFPVTCRNCGELNLFTSPPPERVKCESCGNYFRTDKGPASTSSGPRHGRLHESEFDDDWDDDEYEGGSSTEFGLIRAGLGKMYPVICTNCSRVNLILSPPPAQVNCDHCHRSFSAYAQASLAQEEAYALWKSHQPVSGTAGSSPGMSTGDKQALIGCLVFLLGLIAFIVIGLNMQ